MSVPTQVESLTEKFKEAFNIDIEVTANGVWFEVKREGQIVDLAFVAVTQLEYVAKACRESEVVNK